MAEAASLRDRLRPLWRIPAVLIVTVVAMVAVTLARFLLFFHHRWQKGSTEAIYRWWGRIMARLLGAEIRIEGEPPSSPFLAVSNHLSYLDIFILAGATGGVFIAKAEIARWPLVGLACKTVDTLFVDRETRRDVVRVGEQIQATLGRGRGVILFAEGTTSAGSTVAPFRTPLLAPAAISGLGVFPITLTYHTPEGTPAAVNSVCWWGDRELIPHLRQLARIPRFYATVKFGSEPIHHPDRKRMAQELHQAVLERFVPVTGAEEI